MHRSSLIGGRFSTSPPDAWEFRIIVLGSTVRLEGLVIHFYIFKANHQTQAQISLGRGHRISRPRHQSGPIKQVSEKGPNQTQAHSSRPAPSAIGQVGSIQMACGASHDPRYVTPVAFLDQELASAGSSSDAGPGALRSQSDAVASSQRAAPAGLPGLTTQ